MSRPLVSVILTAYNAEKFIRQAIESVLGQTYRELELLIYNDGSTDGTDTVIAGFEDSRIRYWKAGVNRHIAYGTNFLLKKCTGDYIAIIDADDIWKAEKLEKQIGFLLENPQYSCCFSRCDLIDNSGTVCNDSNKACYEMFQASTQTREYWLRYFFFEGNQLCNPSAVFSAASARETGIHNPFYIQATDMEWYVRYVKKYTFAVLEEPLVLYRCNFDEEGKTSGFNEANVTRYVNELACIRMHFFEGLDNALFRSAFHEFFVHPDASTDEELECEKLMLQLIPYNNAKSIPASGLFLLERAMEDERLADLLAEKYGLTTGKVGELSGRHVLNDILTEKYAAENACLREQKYTDEINLTHYKEAAAVAVSDKAEAERKLAFQETLTASLQERLKLLESGADPIR